MSARIEIFPKLWIGFSKYANVKELNKRDGIDILIDTESDLSFIGTHTEYNPHIGNNLEKYEILKMYEYLSETSKFIYDNILNGKGILVHCHDCSQKSATIIAGFLIRYGKVDRKTAIKIVKSKCQYSFIDGINFDYSLEKFENYINNS